MSYKPWAKGKRSVCGRIAFFFFWKWIFWGYLIPCTTKNKKQVVCVCWLLLNNNNNKSCVHHFTFSLCFFVFFVGFLCLVVFSFCSIVFLNAARVSSKCWCYLNLLVCCLFACVFLSRSSLSSVQLVTLWVFLSLFRFINLYFGTVNQ